MRSMLSLGLQIDTRDAHGNTPLHAAAAGGHAHVLRTLVINNADTAAINSEGHNAQHCAQMAHANMLVRYTFSDFGLVSRGFWHE